MDVQNHSYPRPSAPFDSSFGMELKGNENYWFVYIIWLFWFRMECEWHSFWTYLVELRSLLYLLLTSSRLTCIAHKLFFLTAIYFIKQIGGKTHHSQCYNSKAHPIRNNKHIGRKRRKQKNKIK